MLFRSRHPLHLSTGRLRDQWHGMSRTGRVARLFNHVEEPLLSMSTRDMDRRQLRDGDLVLMVGFGAGMTAASAIVRWTSKGARS